MATVTKPIALDESLHTTELTPRNLADVLAQALQALTTVVSGLNFINAVVVAELPTVGISTTTIYLVPSDDPQSENIYDEYINLDGTSAGWEKIGDTEIDLSDYYTKTETDTLLSGKVDKVNGKGLSTNDYTDTEKAKLAGIEANAEVNVQSDWSQADSSADDYIKNKPSNLVSDASYVHTDNNFTNAEKTKLGGIESGAEVNVQSDWNEADNTADDYIKNKPSSEVKSATDTFTTVNGGLLEECNIELTPIQDLHGYPEPWVGGSRKNKLPLVLADIKSANTIGTWSGNSYVLNGVTFTINTDDAENIVSIDASGTANNNANFRLYQIDNPTNEQIDYLIGKILNGCPSGGSSTSYYQFLNVGGSNRGTDQGSGLTIGDISEYYGTTQLYIGISIRNNYSISGNLSFYPMLRSSADSADFEPYSNICPISGHTEVDLYNVGKNKLPRYANTTSYGIPYTVNDDGSVSYSGTQSGAVDSRIFSSVTLKAGNYIVSGASENSSLGYGDMYVTTVGGTVLARDYSGLAESDSTFTLAEDTLIYVGLRGAPKNSSAVVNGKFYPMLRKATDSADFEPYLGHLYQVQIGSTVYGGYVDLVSGVMNVEYGYIASYNGETITEPWISDRDVYVPNTSPTTGAEVCYKLATPFTIQLTPQQIEALVGQNNLSTPLDGQSIDSVKYREVFAFDDVEKVVSLRVPISMLGTDESGRTTASQAYASGDYFYKDGYMCKALTSISAGATLTLNTNYSQGTLADILKAIENA